MYGNGTKASLLLGNMKLINRAFFRLEDNRVVVGFSPSVPSRYYPPNNNMGKDRVMDEGTYLV